MTSPGRAATSSTTPAIVPDERPARVLFLGSGKVGKTSLVRRFLDNVFEEKYQPTVEDLYQRTFEVRDRVAHIELMDTSGSYDFPAMRQVWIKAASAFVLVFSQNDLYSFQYVQMLLTQIREERSDYETFPFVVVCNKVDLPVREKSFADGSIELWVSETGLTSSQFVYSSCKTNSHVVDVFEKLWKQNELSGKIPFASLQQQQQQQLQAQQQGGSGFANSTRRRFSALVDVSPAHATSHPPKTMVSFGAASSSSQQSQQKPPSKGILNRFGSQKRQSLRVKSNKKGNQRNPTAPIRLDCVIS